MQRVLHFSTGTLRTFQPASRKEIINGLMDRKDKYFAQYDKVIVDFELTMTSEGPRLTVAYLKQLNRAAQGQ
jgi:hypothetical protein